MDKLNFKKKCSDPLLRHKDQCRKKSLKIIPVELIKKFPELKLTIDHKLCKQCREFIEFSSKKEISDIYLSLILSDTDSSSSGVGPVNYVKDDCAETNESSSDSTNLKEHEFSTLNESLAYIGETPITKRKLIQQKAYGRKKMKKIEASMKKKIENLAKKEIPTGSQIKKTTISEDSLEKIDQLKNKYHDKLTKK
ncbi:UNVERIFIED_CONTAM: hypothetical protein RMT77_018215 [Armadillidium vulgare]